MSVFKIAEIGINHNGELELAKKMIIAAKEAGADAVKFQKRTIETVYTQSELDVPRKSPYGDTNRALKEQLELGQQDFEKINELCGELGIMWSASCWDVESQKFLAEFNVKFNKVASPMLTNRELLEAVASEGKLTYLSTGMSEMETISAAVEIFEKAKCPFELMHCVSAYPTPEDIINLRAIDSLKGFGAPVGFSSHDVLDESIAMAVAMGITSVERHVTLDRSMFGSDQKVSITFEEFKHMSDLIEKCERILGSGEKRVAQAEVPALEKLRRVNTL